jgi:septal ring factor EnvC (AmiA/AmiB activator)
MSIFEVIPIEEEGISVITCIIFFFAGVSSIAVLKWIISRLDKHDERLDCHEKVFDEVRHDFADGRVQFTEIKGSVKQTQTIVDRIDKSLSDIAKTNTKVIESYLRKE